VNNELMYNLFRLVELEEDIKDINEIIDELYNENPYLSLNNFVTKLKLRLNENTQRNSMG